MSEKSFVMQKAIGIWEKRMRVPPVLVTGAIGRVGRVERVVLMVEGNLRQRSRPVTIRRGDTAPVADRDVVAVAAQTLLAAPRSFRQWVADHATALMGGPASAEA